jgi:hypothetical protein
MLVKAVLTRINEINLIVEPVRPRIGEGPHLGRDLV